ncbi:unnamed protein product, partial [Mesorhabditis spiculigera]
MPDSSTETGRSRQRSFDVKTGLKKRHLTMLSMGGVRRRRFLRRAERNHQPGRPRRSHHVRDLRHHRVPGDAHARRNGRGQAVYGSFTEYARMALGDWAGFTTGWLYWYFWVIVDVGIESVVGATLLSRWIHGVPLWLMSAVLLLVMTGVNLLSVSNFGEAEYWFAGIKVAVIIGFIVLGSLFVFGIWPGSEVDFSNLTGHEDFCRTASTPVLVGVVAVIFSMTGAELVTIAAAESAEPAGAIRRATNTVVFRILAFFVVATFLLVTMLPWDSFVVGDSPFISALDLLGIPGAADILNLVVLVAVLSCLNSGLYTASRMLFALSVYNDAPAWMTRTNSRGVPVKGVLACTVAGYFCIAAGYIWPDTIFLFLVNSSGAICLFVYILICVSELRLRRRWERESPEILKFRVWLYPGLPIVVTGLILSDPGGNGSQRTDARGVRPKPGRAGSHPRRLQREKVSYAKSRVVATASNNAHSSSKKA